MTFRTALLAASLLLSAAPALAQTTPLTCPASDVGCRVAHNDSAVLHSDLQALIAAIKAGGGAPAPSSGGTAPPATTLSDPCVGRTGKWAALTVDPTVSISAALQCAAPAFKLTLLAGTYLQVFHVPDGLDGWDVGGPPGGADTVKLDGQGGCTVDQNNAGSCPTRLAFGKGVIHASSPGTIHDLEVRGGGLKAMGNHDLQAGVYFEGGNGGTVTLRRLMLRNNENGAAANTNATYDFVFDSVDFVGNGTDWGSHSAYMGGGKSLTLLNIHDYGSFQGNNQKSRIPVVTASGGFNRSVQGRWIECADGCALKITGGQYIGNTCCQNIFGNGTESQSKGPGNTVWSDSEVYIGRWSAISNAGTFDATNVLVHGFGQGPGVVNDKGGALNGFAVGDTKDPPADPPYISGAKS